MGILKMATADYQHQSLVNVVAPADFAISSTQARTGTYSYRMDDNANNSIFGVGFPTQGSTKTTYYRFGMYLTGSNQCVASTWGVGNSQHAIKFQSGTVTLYQSTIFNTTLASASYTSVDGWYTIEFAIYNHPSAGTAVIKMDGTTKIDYTGDTYYSTYEQNEIRFAADPSSGYTYIDDIIVRDDDWPGRGGIHVLVPNAGSTTENWTPSAGNPEDCVDEQPPDFADYISTDTSVNGTDQLFGIESLPITPTEISGVGVLSFAALDNPGTTYGMSIINSNGTKASGEPIGFTASSGVIDGYWHQNPDDSAAWENADITALEVGIESVVP